MRYLLSIMIVILIYSGLYAGSFANRVVHDSPRSIIRGQDARIDSVGLWSLILVRPGLPDDVVYRLARAIHRGEGALEERLKQGRYTKARNTVAQVPAARLHPGAARYYDQAGFAR